MKMKNIPVLLFVAFMVFTHGLANAANDEPETNLLFKIERSRDADQVFYALNTLDNGTLNLENPIRVYWYKRTENNKTEPLTRIQKKFGYGLKFLTVTAQSAQFKFVSFPKKIFELQKQENGKFAVFTIIDNEKVEVDHLYILFNGGTYLFPKIAKVELHEKGLLNNKKIIHKIKN